MGAGVHNHAVVTVLHLLAQMCLFSQIKRGIHGPKTSVHIAPLPLHADWDAFCPQIIECVFFHKFFLHQQLVAALEGPPPHNGRSHLRSCVQPPCAHPLRIGQLRHRARQHQDPILDLTQILLTTIFQVLPWPPSTRGAPKFTLHIFRMPEQPKEGGIWAFITLYGQDNEPALARSHLQ